MRFPHGETSPRSRGERDAAAAGRRAQGGRLAPPSARSSPAPPGSLKRPWSSRYGGAGKQLPRGVGADSKWERRLQSPSAMGADRWTLLPGVKRGCGPTGSGAGGSGQKAHERCNGTPTHLALPKETLLTTIWGKL